MVTSKISKWDIVIAITGHYGVASFLITSHCLLKPFRAATPSVIEFPWKYLFFALWHRRRDTQHSTDNCSSMLKLGPNKKRPTDAPTAQTSPPDRDNPKTEANSAGKHLVVDARTNLIRIYIPCNPSHCPMQCPGLQGKRITSEIISTLNLTPSAFTTNVGKIIWSKLSQIWYLISPLLDT